MQGDRWCVVVVRGWMDGDDVKIRMLASGSTEASAVVGSVSSAADQLAVWLSGLRDDLTADAPAADGPETPG